MPDENPFKEFSDHILAEMNAWNVSHPQATFLQIEEKARELVSQLEAHLIQESALEREPEEWTQGQPSQRARCPDCQVPCSGEASACGISKDQQAETLSCKEPRQPVPRVEPAFSPLDEQLGLQPGSLSPETPAASGAFRLLALLWPGCQNAQNRAGGGGRRECSSLQTASPSSRVKTVQLSYFSRMSDADTCIELATGELERRGVYQALQVAAVQDGAEWIERLIDAHRADAVRILAFYHASEYVSQIATLGRNAGTAMQKREKLMHYPRFEHQGWPIGSGSAESANTCVVQQRGVWARHALGRPKCQSYAGSAQLSV